MLPSKQEITKTTVMNKVHSIADEIPDKIYDKPRTVPYLHIEAEGRYELVNKYYFSGLYPGTKGNKQL